MSLSLALLAVSAITPITYNIEVEQKAAAAAIKACAATPIAFALLDAEGAPRLLVVGDGARSLFGSFAIRKAATALAFQKPSSAVRDEAKSDPALAERLKTDPKLIGFGGGLPIPGGALAVAGAPSQDLDETCAKAALAVLPRP
jgi:uncharacterized protein GlcG (DUF336 family)